jgi:hypothetical protein
LIRASLLVFTALVAALLTQLPACAYSGEAALFDAGPQEDAGPEEREVGDCLPDDVDCPLAPESPLCGDLVTACCGETCTETAACAAAQLLQTYEPERCSDALLDTQTYPHCELGNCDSLLIKVCGVDDACPDAPGCDAARALHERSTDTDATQQEIDAASSACLQALEDEAVFAPCQ